MKHAGFLLAMLAACGGSDFSAAVDLVETGSAVDAQLDVVVADAVNDAARENVATEPEPRAEAEAFDVQEEKTGFDGAHESSVADARDAGEAEAGPEPLRCRSIDGTQCQASGPWPFSCCRASPCECCNKPNCGTVDP